MRYSCYTPAQKMPATFFSATNCCKLSVILLVIITFCLYLQYLCFSFVNWSVLPQSSVLKPSNTTVVLLWNAMFTDTRWTLPVDTMHMTCPRVNCIITNQHNYLNKIEDYTAIVFHTARAFPRFNALPLRRDPRQWYIFTVMESPENTEHKLHDRNSFFNLTMSYRLDADVVWSYNHVTDKVTNATVAPAWQPAWRPVNTAWTQTNAGLLAAIAKKTKLVAWFVSNCRVKSARENLVRQLEHHIPIDIYGKCGKLKCQYDSESCNSLLDTDYKFYLSFENSLCSDYVTEKLYNALGQQLVPVVFGGANYTRFAPPHSYIDAQAFQNVSTLAAYLLHLHNTPKEYATYFWWRQHYSVSGMGLQLLPVCELCERVTVPETQQRTQVYHDIERYWRHKTCTQRSTIKF